SLELSRWFRFYEKKRGDRRTVPKKFGSVGEALFFGFFFAVGCAGVWAMLDLLIVPEWRANPHFVETTCTVIEKRVGERDEKAGKKYRPEVTIRYEVEGKQYEPTT